MSDTPETDEQFKSFPAYFEIDLFCRKLERERDEARAVAYDLAVIASHCLGSHGSALLTETSERIADTLKRWRELKQ
jgi:hypothetical protein